jgi:glycosyltransferase involved in cell wall biosynthesis
MRLLYCIPSLSNPGGMERILTEKVNYLTLNGDFQVLIVTTEQGNNPVRFNLNGKVEVVNLNIHFNKHFNYSWLRKYYFHRRKLSLYKHQLINLIIQRKIDVVISLCGKEIEFLKDLKLYSSVVAELHFGMHFRKQFLLANHKGFFWKVLGNFRTYQFIKSTENLDRLVVLTEADANNWRALGRDVVKIPNFLNSIGNSYSNLSSKKVISVGRLDAQKGYDLLLRVWIHVTNKHPDWTLDIYGQGHEYNSLNSFIQSNDLEGTVKLKGIINNVDLAYLSGSIFVLSSRYEGFGMVLIEAMNCGLPVIAFDCDHGPSDIIINRVDGFLIEVGNLEDMAEKLCTLIESEQLRKEMGAKALENVKRYAKDEVMSLWINLFKQLKIN